MCPDVTYGNKPPRIVKRPGFDADPRTTTPAPMQDTGAAFRAKYAFDCRIDPSITQKQAGSALKLHTATLDPQGHAERA